MARLYRGSAKNGGGGVLKEMSLCELTIIPFCFFKKNYFLIFLFLRKSLLRMFGKTDFWGVGEIEGQKVIVIWWLKLFLFVFMIIK